MGVVDDLVRIPSEERQIQDQRYPVAIDKEQEGEESMDGGFGNDVLVEVLAKVDGVCVVAFQIAVHDGEEDLQEQVDGVNQHRQQKQPCFARHHWTGVVVRRGEIDAKVKLYDEDPDVAREVREAG